jgi:hypothetical protein
LGGIIIVLVVIIVAALNVNNPTGSRESTATATVEDTSKLETTPTEQGGGQQASTVTPTAQGGNPQVTVPPAAPPTELPTQPLASCEPGWLPDAGCTCCGTTLTCADGTVATFNPQCGVGGGSSCKCVPVDAFCTQFPGCAFHCTETGAACTP